MRASSPILAGRVEADVLGEVARLEQIFTIFDEASALNELHRTGSTAVPELQAVLALAAEWQQRSGGAFDPGIGELMHLWDDAEASGAPPGPTAIAEVLAARDNRSQTTAVDNLNAIAKGWIAQAAVDRVDTSGGHGGSDGDLDSVWLSLGGDVVHRGAGSLRVGIEDPHRPYDNVAPLASIEITNEALATSGGTRRWWTIDGRRYPKVLDPRTGEPVDHVASATVVARDAATADVLATIATVASEAETLALMREANAECLLIRPDRSHVASTSRFKL